MQQLINALQNKNISVRGNFKKVKEVAVSNNIPLSKDVPVVEEGWVNKPKGMLQILYEHGFLDQSKVNSYTLSGKTDLYGHPIPDTSLKAMINSLYDFQNEETLLQYHGRLLGVTVDRTPKCHPEIAGEGIEYAWAAAKLHYRRLRIVEKRTKDKF